ncbi:MAG: hypothetical protein Q8928_16760 [Bacteroidota bacterium]|nr:hypothetical protein [Bacteroidota bacterium]
MEENVNSMGIINSNAAGIDVGSRSHWVAVCQCDFVQWEVYQEYQRKKDGYKRLSMDPETT